MEDQNGIFLYSNYTGALQDLAVGIRSLVQVYKGNIHIMFGHKSPSWVIEKANTLYNDCGSDYKNISVSHCTQNLQDNFKDVATRRFKGRRYSYVWSEKPYAISMSPFENTIYFDCDHIFLKDIPEKYFDQVADHGLLAARTINHLKGEDVKINGGCIGYKAGSKLMDLWKERLRENYLYVSPKGRKAYERRVQVLAEEYGLKDTVNGEGAVFDKTFSSSPSPDYDYSYKWYMDNCIALHYSNFKLHRMMNTPIQGLSELWMDRYNECFESNMLGIQENLDKIKVEL